MPESTGEQIAQDLPATEVGTAPTSVSQDPRELTFGEKLVGLNFNPSANPGVDSIKRLYASIIDAMYVLVDSDDQLQVKIADTAITQALSAQMMAVKALTWK